MATPGTSSQPSSDAAPGTLMRSATDNIRRCIICFEDEGERTTEPVVRPCTCSLPVHESCLLRWYLQEKPKDDSESRGPSCPQCKAPFEVEEPYDFVVAVRRTIRSKFSQVSPLILGSVVLGGSFASSATYGVIASSTFAGYEVVLNWLGLDLTPGRRVAVSGGRSRQVGTMMTRLACMSSVAPTLILGRAVPFLTNFFLMPFDVLYGLTLFARDDVPTWPPSPRWALLAMPYIQMSYNRLYNYWLGPIERRLNNTLRGLENNPQAEVENNNTEEAGNRFILSDLFDLARTAWILVSNTTEEGGAELDVRIEIGGNVADDITNDGADSPPQIDDSYLEVPAPAAEQYHEEIAGILEEAMGQVREVPPPAFPESVPAPAPQPAARNREGNNNDNRDRDGAVELPSFTFTDLINNMVTSLLFPFISYGMGELIRLSLPRSWTSPPKPIVTSGFFKRGMYHSPGPTGLLQQRWGRSLAGGCLFVVIRDVFELYAKYRNVQVMKGRRIVRKREEARDRRRRNAGAGSQSD